MPRPLPADTWKNLFYPPPDYQYFIGAGQAGFEPQAPGFSAKNASWLADVSLLAYVKDWDFVTRTLGQVGFDKIHRIGEDPALSTKGFIAVRHGADPFAVVAFRGTDKDDPRSLKTDLDPFPLEQDGYTVHRGFAKALDQVWEAQVATPLRDFVGTYPRACIYFTGHSLGAALSTIAVTKSPADNCALYTIGSPRVGDDRLARRVLQKTQRVFRFVNSQDFVTLVPTEVPLEHYYRHVCVEKYIDRDGVIHENPGEFFRGIDLAVGALAHDRLAVLEALKHPGGFLSSVLATEPYIDPPPYIVGNHTPARYGIRLWNSIGF